MIELSRRRFIHGLGLFAAGPAIMRVAAIMPISAPKVIVAVDPAAIGYEHTVHYMLMRERLIALSDVMKRQSIVLNQMRYHGFLSPPTAREITAMKITLDKSTSG